MEGDLWQLGGWGGLQEKEGYHLLRGNCFAASITLPQIMSPKWPHPLIKNQLMNMSFFLTFTLWFQSSSILMFHCCVQTQLFTPQRGTAAYFISILTVPGYWLEIYLDIQSLGLTKMLIAL